MDLGSRRCKEAEDILVKSYVYLAWDIEIAANDDSLFHGNYQWPIVCISVVEGTVLGDKDDLKKRYFTWFRAKADGIDVRYYKKEEDMLCAFVNFTHDYGAKYYIGYNLKDFHIKYVYGRLGYLELELDVREAEVVDPLDTARRVLRPAVYNGELQNCKLVSVAPYCLGA